MCDSCGQKTDVADSRCEDATLCTACADALGMQDITDTIDCCLAIYSDTGSVEGVYRSMGQAIRATVGEPVQIIRMVPAERVLIGG